MEDSRHLGIAIAAPAHEVYDYAVNPTHLFSWAAGLAESTVVNLDGKWFAESPMGRVRVEFVARNDLGVLDHIVTLPGGEEVLNPMRVIPDGERCEVVYTVRRRGMTEEDFERDCRAVATDLQTLRSVMERRLGLSY